MLTDDQMQQLAGQARQGTAYWRDTDGRMRPILRVSVEPVDVERDGMPVPAAFLERGYIDLSNTAPADLFIVRPLFEDN